MVFSAGVHVDGIVMPFPDTSKPAEGLYGLVGRVCGETPQPDEASLKSLTDHSDRLFRKFRPVRRTEFLDFPGWLELTSYTGKQKLKLTNLYMTKFPDLFTDGNHPRVKKRRDELLRVLAFIKKEHYPSYKMMRGILGRDDPSKCLLGPIIKTVENQVYDDPVFIKHVKWHDRPRFMEEKFSKYSWFMASDYTSFEASCKKTLSKATEYRLYLRILGKDMADWLFRQFYGDDLIRFCGMTMRKKFATRYSGETNTALANAVVNWSSTTFLLKEAGITNYELVVEGDDTLIGANIKIVLKAEDYARLGLIAKLEYSRSYNTMSFCGMIFTDDGRIITDPVKVLLKMSWLDSKYIGAKDKKVHALLRGKALSYLHQYRGCPIVQSLCQWILRITRGVRPRFLVEWKTREYIPDEPQFIEVSQQSRILMQEVFGISVLEQQTIEADFDAYQQFRPIPRYPCLEIKDNVWEHTVALGERSTYVASTLTMLELAELINTASRENRRVSSFELRQKLV